MKERGSFWEQVARQTDLEAELFPGQTLVEILGDRRVLIERHCGVTEYSRERITVRLPKGSVQIAGCCLELSRMTRQQLIISGQINGVFLKKGGQ